MPHVTLIHNGLKISASGQWVKTASGKEFILDEPLTSKVGILSTQEESSST